MYVRTRFFRRNALVTGSESGHLGDNDVDDGHTTALSPVYAIGHMRDPLVSWYSWHFGFDFNHPSGYVVPVENDALVAEVSSDGGQTWAEVDRDVSNEQEWLRKQIRIAHYVPITDDFRIRFTMSDDPAQSLAEAMVDDIHIWDESLVCRPDLRPEPEPPVEPTDPPIVENPPSASGKKKSGGCGITSNSPTNHGPIGFIVIGFIVIGFWTIRRRRTTHWVG